MDTRIDGFTAMLYVGLCKKVGTKEEISMRRDLVDIIEAIENRCRAYQDYKVTWSGSYREGFRHCGSDMDWMFCVNNHKVICDLSQASFYNTFMDTLMLMKDNNNRPGYVLLKLLTPTDRVTVNKSCVRTNDGVYISSALYRENTCSVVMPNSFQHGPCGSGVRGGIEYDTAHGFSCDFWPPIARPWLQRCHTWPPSHVLHDIVKRGCHFVPIGGREDPLEDKEWRMSFSVAEQRLIYSMSHCQFLVYSLLKMFLKEVLNHSVNDELLCSYYMKTVVFWQIQMNNIPLWCPQNMIDCFWSCFKNLIQWVYTGTCPNFIVPQNNMFVGKVYGAHQSQLFLQLYSIYKKGKSCLLQCPSIQEILIHNPTCVNEINENSILSEDDFDISLWKEIYERDSIPSVSLSRCLKQLQTVEELTAANLTKYHVVYLQKITATFLQQTAFYLYNMYCQQSHNKSIYIIDKICRHMLKLSAKFGSISEMLYLIMYYYRTCRYTKALSVIDTAKARLSQPYLMYEYVHTLKYLETLGGKSWATKMKEALALNLKLLYKICYLNELKVEQKASWGKHLPQLQIPPFVMLHMMRILIYNHVDLIKRQHALQDLYVLLHNDEGRYVNKELRDISWQTLGICQEVCHDWEGAISSYQESLRHEPVNKIQDASNERIKYCRFNLGTKYQSD